MGFELLLPVVLFGLTLIIIFLLRSEDKRNERSDLIKKKAQALLKNVENSQTQFKEGAQKLEEHISKKMDESHLLMAQVDSQLADMDARSEDLAILQNVLVTYQTSLTQLQSATTQVEQRVVAMKAEVANLERVEESLSGFDLRFEQFKGNLGEQITEGEELLHLQQNRVKEMLGASFIKLQEYSKEVAQVEQQSLEQMAAHGEAFKARQDASLGLVSEQEARLRQLNEDGEAQMLLYESALNLAHKEAHEKLEQQQRQLDQLHETYIEQQKRQEENLHSINERARLNVTLEMQSFVRQCHDEMAQIFELTLRKTDTSFQNMIRVTSQYLKELSARLEQARGVTQLLEASEHTSLLSFKEDLSRLMEDTLKGEQTLKTLEALEEKASFSLSQLHQEAQHLQDSLATMKEKKLALLPKTKSEEPPHSVVFAMALVDEVCTPLEREQAPSEEEPVEKSVQRKAKGEKKIKVEKDSLPEKEKQASPEKRQVEYLAESEEEILLEEDETLPL